MKSIKIFGNEIKLSQFADDNDTTLFYADLRSLEKALKIVEDFGKLAGLYLNVKKTKAIWLGKWMNNKNKPLNISWFHCPVKILGIHFSYIEKGNYDLNFSQTIQKLQTKLDTCMWSSRDLTTFRIVMILKIFGLSQLVKSASNLIVPQGMADLVKTKLCRFLWRNKKDKIKNLANYCYSRKSSIFCVKQLSNHMMSFNPRWRQARNLKANIGDRQTLFCLTLSDTSSRGFQPKFEIGQYFLQLNVCLL